MQKKYEMIKENGSSLYRIKALRDFDNISKGDLGGLIEKESNLSHEGTAWVYESAEVSGDACVYGEAKVYGSARVYGNAKLRG